MTWDELCREPQLRDLNYKIETNQHGQIVMSPPTSVDHADQGGEILALLRRFLPDGRTLTEPPVQTTGGVKVPDAAWISRARRSRHRGESVLPVAPEICVEVLSPSNSAAEIAEKRRLYLEAGAAEFWQCAADGQMSFFGRDGAELTRSVLCPEFPLRVSLE